MPPKTMRKKTRNEMSTGWKRAAHTRRKRLASAVLEARAIGGAAICTSCVGTVCIFLYLRCCEPRHCNNHQVITTDWRPHVGRKQTTNPSLVCRSLERRTRRCDRGDVRRERNRARVVGRSVAADNGSATVQTVSHAVSRCFSKHGDRGRGHSGGR